MTGATTMAGTAAAAGEDATKAAEVPAHVALAVEDAWKARVPLWRICAENGLSIAHVMAVVRTAGLPDRCPWSRTLLHAPASLAEPAQSGPAPVT